MNRCLLLLLPVLLHSQPPPIGSGLHQGMELIYESGGAAQAPWIHDAVAVVRRPDFDRCVVVTIRNAPPAESCVRGDTLFRRLAADDHLPVRVVGSNMEITVPGAGGSRLQFRTGTLTSRKVGGGPDYFFLPTTIVTSSADGTATRRLREEYSPELLTALGGVFEEPDGAGGWRLLQEFSLREVRP